MSRVIDAPPDVTPRTALPAERAKLAELFDAIGNAANATIRDMPDAADDTARRQMMHTLASVGGFVIYADMLRQGPRPTSPDTMTAVIQLGRALSRRIEVRQ